MLLLFILVLDLIRKNYIFLGLQIFETYGIKFLYDFLNENIQKRMIFRYLVTVLNLETSSSRTLPGQRPAH